MKLFFSAGYLVAGVLGIVSCIIQVTLLILLATFASVNTDPHMPLVTGSGDERWAWIQFLGGAQGAMAVLVGAMVAGVMIMSRCGKTLRENVVGVYQPR